MSASHVLSTISDAFDGHDLDAFEWQNQPVVIAAQVAGALGYADTSDLTQHWSDEAEEGIEYFKVTSEDIRRDYPSLRRYLPPHARHLILLTESGATLALLQARTAAAKALRRFICRDLLPRLRRAPAAFTVPASLALAPAGAVIELLGAEAAAGQEYPALRAALQSRRARVSSQKAEPYTNALEALRLIVKWAARDNAERIATGRAPGQAPRGGWLGRWSAEGDLCIDHRAVRDRLGEGGFDAHVVLRAWTRAGWLREHPGTGRGRWKTQIAGARLWTAAINESGLLAADA